MNNIIRRDLEDIYTQDISWDDLNGKTVLITGAYGMLASYVTYMLYYLHEEKNISVSIIVVVKSKVKFLDRCNIFSRADYLTVIENDLSNPLKIEGPLDYIIHAASLASPRYYETCPIDVILPNIIGNYHLLNLAAEKGISGYLLFSTGDIYGSVKDVTDITEDSYGTVDTLDAHNCYSESKRMAETMCMAFLRQRKVPVKIARIWHTYAPTMDIDNDPRVFASFAGNILRGEDIVMKSDGSGKRCFCYISDAVAGYFTILLKGAVGEAYNVCNESQFVSMADLAIRLARLYPERNIKVIRKKRNKDEQYSENILMLGQEAVPSSDKLKGLGWKPTVDIETGFNRVIKYKESEQ
ncbi:NAD-dependent epimerase/dehydratase family protein [Acetatifactor aquisgranensis]|uniref:NAD-dependent epimerase/dehydratase family protein n=1 Tax=Acetatifactor aquisgranensis TaxID=2941233 RepID=UPI00203C56A9|nr:NAD-dependent epimerase/dehydratase family protein [Acetatifactor aquisgranensis]